MKKRARVKIIAIATCVIGFIALSGCLTGRDHRRFSSDLRKGLDRRDTNEEVREKLLVFTPVGSLRGDVYDFLEKNLKGSSELYLNPSPPPNWHPKGYSSIYSDLWIRYVFIFGQFETVAYYVFNERQQLVELKVYKADSFW